MTKAAKLSAAGMSLLCLHLKLAEASMPPLQEDNPKLSVIPQSTV